MQRQPKASHGSAAERVGARAEAVTRLRRQALEAVHDTGYWPAPPGCMVYLAVNLNSGKSYVGCAVDFQRRVCAHRAASELGKTPLYHAIRKHGWGRFAFVPIEFFETEEEMHTAEQAAIVAWRTQDSEVGYNVADGGDGLGSGGARTVHARPEYAEYFKSSYPARAIKAAKTRARRRAEGFYHRKGKNPTRTEQLSFISSEERAAALTMAECAAAGEKIDATAETLLRQKDTAADIAMFGRMLADNPDYNREAAVQVAHAITTHKVAVEDDYYVAVDDLKTSAEDAGAGFLGEAGFAAGLFYLYICVDTALLKRNLSDEGLAAIALSALVRAAATVAPTGKQASFASRARANYVLAEAGDQTPRTLAGAFLKPIDGKDPMEASVKALQGLRESMDAAYGPCADRRFEMLVGGTGTLEEVLAFCRAV
jgi:CRISPR system Cascade subunit CasC